jgi:hypothetical protein
MFIEWSEDGSWAREINISGLSRVEMDSLETEKLFQRTICWIVTSYKGHNNLITGYSDDEKKSKPRVINSTVLFMFNSKDCICVYPSFQHSSLSLWIRLLQTLRHSWTIRQAFVLREQSVSNLQKNAIEL